MATHTLSQADKESRIEAQMKSLFHTKLDMRADRK